MRLTLRTLLAYLDDTLEPAEIKEIGQKVAESQTAQELIARIKQVSRRRRLSAPPPASTGGSLDPNTVAEYLDNTLPSEQLAEVEKLCLESDVSLAEIATCHQILTLVLGEPALVPPSAKRRMYALVDGNKSGITLRPMAAHPTAPATHGADDSGEDETLLLGLPAMSRGAWMRWLIPLAGCLLLAGLAVAIWQALSPDSSLNFAQRDGGKRERDAAKPGDGKPADKDKEVDRDKDPDKDKISDRDKQPDKDRQNDKDKPPDKDKDPDHGKPSVPPKEAPWPPPPPNNKPQAAGVLVHDNALQDLLMATPTGTHKWRRLVAKDRVMTGDELVSLPGYRSKLDLESGVQLILWGNVFGQLDMPLRESAVTLHAVDSEPLGVASPDVDFTLSRGRVWLVNHKKGGKDALVRVRFHKEVWDLTLKPGTEAFVELLGGLYGWSAEVKEEEPWAFLYLVVSKGLVNLRDDFHQERLPGPAVFWWDRDKGATQTPDFPTRLGPEASQSIQNAKPVERALDSLQGRLARPDKAVSVMLADALKTAEERGRQGIELCQLIVLCHGALDNVEEVLEALDSERPWVRDSAVEALRQWLARKAEQRGKLKTALLSRFRETEVDHILQLLRAPNPQEREQADKFEYLIDQLDNDKLAIRHLANWWLLRLANKYAMTFKYDPNGPVEHRQAIKMKWQDLLDKKLLPPPLPASPKDKPGQPPK
jgi:hypothetical protein